MVAGPIDNSGTLVVNRPDDHNFTNTLTGLGTLEKAQSSTLTFPSSTLLDGALALTGGKVRFTVGGTLNGIVSGGGELEAAGGTLYLGGTDPNTHTGMTTVSAGALQLGKPVLPLLLDGDRFLELLSIQDETVTGGRLPSDAYLARLRALAGMAVRPSAPTTRPTTPLLAPGDLPAGRVVAWGNNHNGQASVPRGLAGVVAVAAGLGHSLALHGDGHISAWGNDRFGQARVPDGLAGVVAVPMMLGAGPGHALAPELLLKPVLVELGATCPTKGLYLLDTTYDDPATYEPWLSVARPQFLAALGGRPG